MKSIKDLVDFTYTLLASDAGLDQYLGKFNNNFKAIGYKELPPYVKSIPQKTSVFIIFDIESSNGIPSESMTRLSDSVIKFYISGNDAMLAADRLITLMNGKLIGTHFYSYRGIVSLDGGDVTLRFQAI